MTKTVPLTIIIVFTNVILIGQPPNELIESNKCLNQNLIYRKNNNISIDTSITKAIEFLSNNYQLLEFDFGSYAIANYLHRKFGLKKIYHDKTADSIIKYIYHDNEDIYFFSRLIDSSAKPISMDVLAKFRGIDSITIQALWSDEINLDKKAYYSRLKKTSMVGNYELTHSLLACVWLEETGFSSNKEFAFSKLKSDISKRIYKHLLKNVSFWSDDKIEAIALLLYANKNNKIKSNWITEIILNQQTDGGWAFSILDNVSSIHTTSLALWALLEYNNDTNKNIHWIQN